MSKQKTKEEIIQHKKSAIRAINNLLENYISSESEEYLKKADLISYWTESFAKYISMEESFSPERLKSYKRGDVIKLNFGFNVGSEYGGLHYAIVINNHNARNSPVLTVVPLTSQKGGDEIHPDDVWLGNELYRNLKLKHDTIQKNLEGEKENIEKMVAVLEGILRAFDGKMQMYNQNQSGENLLDAGRYLEVAKDLTKEWRERSSKNAEATAQLKKIGTEIKRMKEGSIALVSQITTVSKMRIYDPRNARGVLSGIRLSPESMDKINDKLKDLYIF